MSAKPSAISDALDALRNAAIDDPEVPEMVRGFLSKGATLDALQLGEFGRWTYNGAAVEHPRVLALFSRSLQRTEAGTWLLNIPPYTYPVLVEGTGWFIDRLRGTAPEGAPPAPSGVWGRTLGGEWVPIDWSTLETDGNDYLGIRTERGRARLINAAYADLADALDADDDGWLVRWNGASHRIALRVD